MLSTLHGALVALAVVALFGVTIFVHEAGHFVAARFCGMVIEAFSIGFGPAVWKRKRNGVVYKIGCIPFGGYVALPQLDPAGMRHIQSAEPGAEGAPEPLPRVAAWKKIVVSASGAAGNVLLAVALAWLCYAIGMPAGPAERSATIGYVDPQSAAWTAGLRIGDEILAVNGTPVKRWRDFRMEAALRPEVSLRVRCADRTEKELSLRTERGPLGEQAVQGLEGLDLCMVLSVEPGSAAAESGLKREDLIVRFSGRDVLSRAHLVAMVDERRDQPTELAVRREVGGETVLVDTQVTPRLDPAVGRARIGVQFNVRAVERDTVVRPLPSEQLREHALAIFRFLGALVTPKQARAASQAVGGPVAIVMSYWIIVKASLMLAIWFTGFLNVNLAILNLLPIPVLDGGHILFSLWEMATRRPASPKAVNVLVNLFAILLIAAFVFLSFRDLDRLTPLGGKVRGWLGREAPGAVTNAAAPAPAPASGPAGGK